MKVGEQGEVTIPQPIREQFGINPDTEVVFQIVNGAIVLSKVNPSQALDKWRGYCNASFQKMNNESVDEFIEDIRGR